MSVCSCVGNKLLALICHETYEFSLIILPIFLHFISNSFLDLILFSFPNETEGNSINSISIKSFNRECASILQVLELTDALAVNSTAVRLEWHLLLSDTEYYIEVIQWNNLIGFAISKLLKHSFARFFPLTMKLFHFFSKKFRACTSVTVT